VVAVTATVCGYAMSPRLRNTCAIGNCLAATAGGCSSVLREGRPAGGDPRRIGLCQLGHHGAACLAATEVTAHEPRVSGKT